MLYVPSLGADTPYQSECGVFSSLFLSRFCKTFHKIGEGWLHTFFYYRLIIAAGARAVYSIMAIIDVVKCVSDGSSFCQKFPSEDLRLGSQLVVYPGQTAFFVKDGNVCDEFTNGSYTLKSENIPILKSLINIPFGGDSPFQAEVWFVSSIPKLDIMWGTSQAIQLEDPQYGIIVPVRAFGQYGLKVSKPRVFFERLIGNRERFTSEDIDRYFKGKLVSLLSNIISDKIIKDNIPVLELSSHLMEMSEYCNSRLNIVFNNYGLDVVEFSFMSINVPEDDPSVIKIKEMKAMVAQLKIAGKDVYQMNRSFDILEKAASNEGVGGQILAMQTGIGAGQGIGTAMSGIAGQTMNLNPGSVPPPIPQEKTYCVYLNGQQICGLAESQVLSYINQGIANGETLAWTSGMPSWSKLSLIPEFMGKVSAQTPPPIK